MELTGRQVIRIIKISFYPRGTRSSNPFLSSGESANFRFLSGGARIVEKLRGPPDADPGVGIARISPSRRAGDGVSWQGRTGIFRRDVGDGEHAEIAIAERVYRVRITEFV